MQGMITKDDVRKIATLAKIKISEEEEEKMQKDLSAILDYFKMLEEVDTLMIEPLARMTVWSDGQSHVVDIRNVVREDRITDKGQEEGEEIVAKIVKSAPDRDDGFIKVRAVM